MFIDSSKELKTRSFEEDNADDDDDEDDDIEDDDAEKIFSDADSKFEYVKNGYQFPKKKFLKANIKTKKKIKLKKCAARYHKELIENNDYIARGPVTPKSTTAITSASSNTSPTVNKTSYLMPTAQPISNTPNNSTFLPISVSENRDKNLPSSAIVHFPNKPKPPMKKVLLSKTNMRISTSSASTGKKHQPACTNSLMTNKQNDWTSSSMNSSPSIGQNIIQKTAMTNYKSSTVSYFSSRINNNIKNTKRFFKKNTKNKMNNVLNICNSNFGKKL